MNKFLFFIFMFPAIYLSAEVKVEKVYLEKKFAGYLVHTQFFKTILLAPGKSEPGRVSGNNVIRGGVFKSITPKNSANLLGQGKGPAGIMRYGLAQVFEPIGKNQPGQKGIILPGVGKGETDAHGALKITEIFPWESTIVQIGDKKEKVKISFSQDCDIAGKALNYKMSIDYIFSDTALVEIKGVFLNLSDKPVEATVSPAAVFNNTSYQTTPWIEVPCDKSRIINEKKINYIDCIPVPVKTLRDYYEFPREHLSETKPWIAVGGLEEQGNLVLMSKKLFQKVLFWKGRKCFSLQPYIRIEAKPQEQTEWEWKLFIGRGMDCIDKVTEQGLFGVKLDKYDYGRRFKCQLQFLPSITHKGVLIDVLLKSARGSLISTKSYETYKLSPLNPETISMKLPSHIDADKRYSLKLEILENEKIFLTAEQWIFPE